MNVYSTTCRPRSRHFRKRNMFETRYLFIRSNGQIVGHGSGEQTSALVCSSSRVFTFEKYTSLCSGDVKFISNPRKNRCTEKIVKRKGTIFRGKKVGFFRHERPISVPRKQQLPRNEQEVYIIRLSREGA